MSNIKITIDELHKAFYKLNETIFFNQLPEPAILIQGKGNKKNILGWCSLTEIWINKDMKEKKYEINIVAESLNRSKDEIITTLLHEMCHLYNLINDIKDTSRNGTYHNKKFKNAAEDHGLIVSHDKKLGWNISELAPQTKQLIKSFNLNDAAFELYKINDINAEGEGTNGSVTKKKKTSSKKYICPKCGAIIRTSKELNVICGDCKTKFIEKDQ